MVNESVKGKGVTNEAVLSAMRKVPRHLFVQEALANRAYDNCPQPIGHGQTISQPYIVGLMTELLEPEPGLRVLEIGTGSGYQAAILAEIGMEVYTVERIRELFLETRERLHAMKYFKIRFKLDDGTLGWPEQAPFDRIMVTAGGHSVPAPLLEQLADPGILVIPVGSTRRHQTLIQVRKKDGRISQEVNCGVAFVDLVGAHGW